MRTLCAILALATAAAGPAPPREKAQSPKQAVSAGRYAAPAVARLPLEQGYSRRVRRMADCLATYRNYDPKIDRIRLRGGATRACEL